MVIAVCQRFDVLRMGLYIVVNLLGRCDARQQQYVIIAQILQVLRNNLIIRSILITLKNSL